MQNFSFVSATLYIAQFLVFVSIYCYIWGLSEPGDRGSVASFFWLFPRVCIIFTVVGPR